MNDDYQYHRKVDIVPDPFGPDIKPQQTTPVYTPKAEEPVAPVADTADNGNDAGSKKSSGGFAAMLVENGIGNLSFKAIIKYAILVILALIIIIPVFSAIKAISKPKTNVTVEVADKVNLEHIYDTEGFLTINQSNEIYVDFIDNDYANHGINETSAIRIYQNDGTVINGYVRSITPCTQESKSVQYLQQNLYNMDEADEGSTDSEIPDPPAQTESSDTDTETQTDPKIYVISCAITWKSEEPFPYTAETKIAIEVATVIVANAISVPNEAIYIGENSIKLVNTVNGSKVIPVEVTTGATNGTRTEIKEGISKDTTYIIAAEGKEISAFKKGDKVSYIKPEKEK